MVHVAAMSQFQKGFHGSIPQTLLAINFPEASFLGLNHRSSLRVRLDWSVVSIAWCPFLRIEGAGLLALEITLLMIRRNIRIIIHLFKSFVILLRIPNRSHIRELFILILQVFVLLNSNRVITLVIIGHYSLSHITKDLLHLNSRNLPLIISLEVMSTSSYGRVIEHHIRAAL